MLPVAKSTFITLVKSPGGIPDVCHWAPKVSRSANKLRNLANSISDALPINKLVLDGINTDPVKVEEFITIAAPYCDSWDEIVHLSAFSRIVDGKKVFYVDFPVYLDLHADDFNLIILSLIELASQVLHCKEMIFCLNNSDGEVEALIHSLFYVGFKKINDKIGNYTLMNLEIVPN